jgi:hypothetical protein
VTRVIEAGEACFLAAERILRPRKKAFAALQDKHEHAGIVLMDAKAGGGVVAEKQHRLGLVRGQADMGVQPMHEATQPPPQSGIIGLQLMHDQLERPSFERMVHPLRIAAQGSIADQRKMPFHVGQQRSVADIEADAARSLRRDAGGAPVLPIFVAGIDHDRKQLFRCRQRLGQRLPYHQRRPLPVSFGEVAPEIPIGASPAKPRRRDAGNAGIHDVRTHTICAPARRGGVPVRTVRDRLWRPLSSG